MKTRISLCTFLAIILLVYFSYRTFLKGKIEKAKDCEHNKKETNLRNNRIVDASSALALVGEAKKSLANATGDEQRRTAADRYREAWIMAINNAWREDTTRKRLIATWNESLGLNDCVPSQICSLYSAWHSELLTDEFWRIFMDSKDKRFISATCFAVYLHGSEEIIRKLKRKRDETKDPEISQIIQNALDWRKYKHANPPGDPGPAALEPTIVQ